jgi:hypothetical protein
VSQKEIDNERMATIAGEMERGVTILRNGEDWL